MSIVVRFKPANLTAQKYDESHPRVEQAGFPPEGLDYHVCFGTDPEHLTVSEIWDSREQMEAWGEKLMPILANRGIGMAGQPEVLEVQNLIRAAAPPQAVGGARGGSQHLAPPPRAGDEPRLR